MQRRGSERDVAVLLRWVRVALVFQQRERANKFRSGQRWFDYFVDEAPFGSDVRIRKLVFQFSYASAPGSFLSPCALCC
jgi:hypothetical protein